MNKKLFLLVTGLVLIGVVALLALRTTKTKASNLLSVYASPINAGCYITAPNQCKIHADPFTIFVEAAPNNRLAEYQIMVGSQIVYRFATDQSNPPSGDYSPSLVALDFAATCGSSYIISLQGRTTDDVGFLNMGSTSNVTCPTTVP